MAIPPRHIANILMTCPASLGSGGVPQVFRDLVQALELEGRRIHLLYQAPLPRVWLRRMKNAWGRDAFYCAMPTVVKESVLLGSLISVFCLPITLFTLVRLLRRQKIDVINCHYLAEYFVYLVLVGRVMRIPVVVSVHGADVDRHTTDTVARRLIRLLVMRGAHQIVASSAAMAAQTIEVFPFVRTKITHVHNALNPADLAVPSSILAPIQPCLLTVARQVAKKGIDTLLRAFALLERDFPDLRLVIVGDGPKIGEHRRLARELGIESRTTFATDPPRVEVLRYFAACSVVVVPSRAEPFGLVVLEGGYYGKPMVCTRVGGIPEIVTDGESALLVAPDDYVAMAAKIAALLRHPERAARLGARANETVMERFLWRHRVKDYIAVYERAGTRSSEAGDAVRAVSPRSTAI